MRNYPFPEVKKESIPAVTRDQMIEVDQALIEDFGITLLQMMENAGRDLAHVARFMVGGDLKERRITVLCGGGNNGGGGMAAARHLLNYGASVRVALAVPMGKLREAPAHGWPRRLLRDEPNPRPGARSRECNQRTSLSWPPLPNLLR